MNRRDFLKAALGAAAALILPPTVEENAEAVRRIWALGAMPERKVYEHTWTAEPLPLPTKYTLLAGEDIRLGDLVAMTTRGTVVRADGMRPILGWATQAAPAGGAFSLFGAERLAEEGFDAVG